MCTRSCVCRGHSRRRACRRKACSRSSISRVSSTSTWSARSTPFGWPQRPWLNAPNDAGERGVIVTTAGRRIRRADWPGRIRRLQGRHRRADAAGRARAGAHRRMRHDDRAGHAFDTPLMAGLPDAARQSLAQQVPFPSRLGRLPISPRWCGIFLRTRCSTAR